MTSDSSPHGAGAVRSHSPLLGSAPLASHTRGFRASIGLANVTRRALGIGLLMVTVVLWTTSSFLASFILSDDTYSKPFFVVYINTSVFAVSLVPMCLQYVHTHGVRASRRALRDLLFDLRQDVVDKVASLRRSDPRRSRDDDDDIANKLLGDEEATGIRRRHRSTSRAGLLHNDADAAGRAHVADNDGAGIDADRDAATAERLLGESGGLSRGEDTDGRNYAHAAAAVLDLDLEAGGAEAHAAHTAHTSVPPDMTASIVSLAATSIRLEQLSVRETTWLSLEFSMLWFSANYLAVACLEYTGVASATIFTSLSSMFTLLFCAVTGVEGFTLRKLAGVVASLVGIALVSSIDLSGQSDEHRGQFPHKTPGEIAIGDAMALLGAVVYGAYVTVMKRRVGHEDRVSMPLFFGLVGLFNVLMLWPGFVILHFTGLETFELPPTRQVWTIISLNSIFSFASDMTWAYAMLLTTPLVVTVGLSLTIPLSLIGEMIEYKKYSSGLYWVGAFVVVLSFLFVNHESHEPDESILEEET